MATFGEKLRQQREQRGISLDAISKTTKISTRLLRALEDERFDQLPGGVFNKGFVRAYARQVGLDEEETLGDYHAALRESQIQDEKILSDFRVQSAKRGTGNGSWALETIERRKQSRRNSDRRKEYRRNKDRRTENHPSKSRVNNESRLKEDRGIEVGKSENRRNGMSENLRRQESRIADFSDKGMSDNDRPANPAPEHREQLQNHPAEISASHPGDFKDPLLNVHPSKDRPVGDIPVIHSPVSDPARDLPVSKTPVPPAIESSSRISRNLIAAVVLLLVVILAVWRSQRRAERVTSPQPTIASNQSFPSSSAPANPSSAAPAQKPGEPSPAVSQPVLTSSSTIPASAKNIALAAPQPPKPFTLIIRADKNTSISVLADGEPVAQENLIAPAATSVRASHDVIVKAGNGAAISFLLNGKSIRPEANDGEARTYVLNSNGLIPAPPAPASNP